MPKRGYIICTTPRSGSTMLCHMLAATGLAGDPHSYFREEDIKEWADDWCVSLDRLPGSRQPSRDFLNAALDAGLGDTPVFGLRLMYESLTGLLTYLRTVSEVDGPDRAVLETAFGPLEFIHLHRDDTVDQAISLLRAEQTVLWHKGADGSEIERLIPVQASGYSFERLRAYVAKLDAQKNAWPQWFRAQGITPLNTRYETLSADPEGGLVTVLSGLGIAHTARDTVTVPTAKLRDSTNAAWKARFYEDLRRSEDAP